mgnify:CR=1 FL=1
MDTQTVIATCEVLLVVIGIIGLVLVRRANGSFLEIDSPVVLSKAQRG